GWIERGRDSVQREVESRSARRAPGGFSDGTTDDRRIGAPSTARDTTVMSVVRERVPALPEVAVFQAIHSRTFRFACRFFALPRARRIARVYAFCRVTDDLVDRPPEGVDPEACLGLWIALSREAYEGRATGIPLL